LSLTGNSFIEEYGAPAVSEPEKYVNNYSIL